MTSVRISNILHSGKGNPHIAGSCSRRSEAKLNESMKSLNKREARESGSESLSNLESCNSDIDACEYDGFQLTVGHYFVEPERLQEMVDNSAVCKECHCLLSILKKETLDKGWEQNGFSSVRMRIAFLINYTLPC